MKKSDQIKAEIAKLKNKSQEAINREDITAEELRSIKNEIEVLNEKLEMQISLENEIGEEGSPIENHEIGEKPVNIGNIFAKAIMNKPLSKEESGKIANLMQEGTDINGGFLVPADVRTKIIELQRNEFDIRNYISIEPTTADEGSRPKQKNEPEAQGFASLDEGKEIQELHEIEFDRATYKIRKYAGYIPVTSELIEDSPENVLNVVTKWMAKNELNTYNYQTFMGTGTKSAEGILNNLGTGGKLESRVIILDRIPTLKDFKDIFNIELENIPDDNIKILVNGKGYGFIDGLLDGNKRSYLQPDSTKKSGKIFLGYETVKVPTKFLNQVELGGKKYTPYIVGNLEALYTMYDRNRLSIESTRVGGSSWRNDTTEVKGIFRFDGKINGDIESISILLVDESVAK